MIPKHHGQIFRVLLPLPIGEGFDYLGNEELHRVGAYVEVPIGNKKSIGIVWEKISSQTKEQKKLKTIINSVDLPYLPAVSHRFVEWVADYTVSPRGAVLKMVFGGRLRLLKKGDRIAFEHPNPSADAPSLSHDQELAVEQILERIKKNNFSVILLDGVTGAGKTEVYSEAIAEIFRQGKQVLVLLPEIAMTAAIIDRLAKRFGVKPTEWHSELSEKQRRINWNAIVQGEAKFVLGARSALFLPYPNLGLIVVDEEHEPAYKQEDGVIYHGRDMAIVRAKLGNIPVILSSATPSLESLLNVHKKKYHHVILRNRFGGADLPEIKIVDLRREKLPAQKFISEPLRKAIEQITSAGQQAMLFLNRRGYAPLTLCRACGYRFNCPNCTSWLIEHKRTKRLHCHHCNFSKPVPNICPKCKSEGTLAACGPGVERIAEEVKALFPDARTAIMASDTIDGPKAAQKIVQQVENRNIDILIGTQIMAKGYHFPRLTLVGVIDADIGLGGGDPRASERSFQLLQQVAGRSGRADEKGLVLLQTTMPDHPVMKALEKGDRDSFMEVEIRERMKYGLPPFSRLACVVVSGKNLSKVIAISKSIAASAPNLEGLRILGPAPAPFAVLRGKHRYRLLAKASKTLDLSTIVRDWLSELKIPSSIRVQVDIDPISFL